MVLLPLEQVELRTSLCKSSIYALTAQGRFPAPVRLAPRRVAWRSDEVESWIESCPPAREPAYDSGQKGAA
ncbi:MAG: AlpA family phage regulatory protein [Rubrivivax sp.]|nr:AlpA family phage regulatory protein [Rubrivivax sp.]